MYDDLLTKRYHTVQAVRVFLDGAATIIAQPGDEGALPKKEIIFAPLGFGASTFGEQTLQRQQEHFLQLYHDPMRPGLARNLSAIRVSSTDALVGEEGRVKAIEDGLNEALQVFKRSLAGTVNHASRRVSPLSRSISG